MSEATTGPGYAYGAIHAADDSLWSAREDLDHGADADVIETKVASAHQSVSEAIRALDEWNPEPAGRECGGIPLFGHLIGLLMDLFVLVALATAIFVVLDWFDNNPWLSYG